MEVFNKLNSVEDDVFKEIEVIDSQITDLKQKLSKLKNIGKVMNPDRIKKLRNKEIKK